MIKNAKKTEAQKQLIKFRNQLHNLLIKYPDIRIGDNSDGDPIATLRNGDQYEQIYLPTSGKQELITQFALGKQEPIRELTAKGVPVSL